GSGDEADWPVPSGATRRHGVLVAVDAPLVLEIEHPPHQPLLTGRALARDALELLPVEVESAGGRAVPRRAGVDEAPPLEPPVLVSGPRLDALVDDEQLVELVRAGVVARERRIRPVVEVEVARHHERVADREVAHADVVEELDDAEPLPTGVDVAVADLLVEA